MEKQGHILKLQMVRGTPHIIGDRLLTPISQRISLGLPNWLSPDEGFVLINQKPKALIIEKDGHAQERPIYDIQSLIIIGLWIFTAFAIIMISRNRPKENHQ